MKTFIRFSVAWVAILFSFFTSIGYVNAQINPQGGFAGGGSGGGSGTVTSIAPADGSLTFTPNPITGTGTIGATGAGSATANQSFGTNASNVFGFYPNAVNSGVIGQLAYYASTGAVLSGNALMNISNGVLSLGGVGSPGGLTLVGNTSGSSAISTPAVSGTNLITLPTGASTTAILQSSSTGVWSYVTALFNGATATTQAATDNSADVATDAFVNTAVANGLASVNPAQSVTAATTSAANTSGLTYNNGAGGVGATFTGTTNTPIVFDGHTLVMGERDLIKNDTQSPSGAFNGVYQVTQIQTSLLPPILTRALDYDQPSDINNTGAIPVITGSVNAATLWVQTANVVTVGTTPLVFAQISGGTTPGGSSGQTQYNNGGVLAGYTPNQTLPPFISTAVPWTYSEEYITSGAVTVFTGVGLLGSSTVTGTPTNADSTDGSWINYATGSTSGNTATLYFNPQYAQCPQQHMWVIKTGPNSTDIQNCRLFVGTGQGLATGSDAPTERCLMFRYATGTDGTLFWRIYTCDGTTGGATTTTIPIAANTIYNLAIDDTNPASVAFYINGVLAGTVSTNLPSGANTMYPQVALTTVSNAAINVKVKTLLSNFQ